MVTKKIDDREIFRKLLEGEKEAYNAFFLKNYYLVYNTICRIIKNKEIAKELTLETFWKAFKKIKLYSSKHPFEAWLVKIAINTALDYIKIAKRKNEVVIMETPMEEVSISTNTLLDEEQYKQVIRKIFIKIASRLSKKQRKIFQMYYFEGKNVSEIAKKFKCSAKSVYYHLNKVRKYISFLFKM